MGGFFDRPEAVPHSSLSNETIQREARAQPFFFDISPQTLWRNHLAEEDKTLIW